MPKRTGIVIGSVIFLVLNSSHECARAARCSTGSGMSARSNHTSG